MSLRNLSLKEIYRSDRDDIISEFFVPCLANCIEYSRCVERISAKSLTTIILAIGDDPDTRVRIVWTQVWRKISRYFQKMRSDL